MAIGSFDMIFVFNLPAVSAKSGRDNIPSFSINEISNGYKRCMSCQNFQYSTLNTARSKPNSPPHKVTSARLSFKALSKSFLAARAAGISVIRPA
jgi:hypothetical protein